MTRTMFIKNTLQISLRTHPDTDVQTQLNELDLPLPITLQQGLSAHLRTSALIVLSAADAWLGATIRTQFLASREPAIAACNPDPNGPPQASPRSSSRGFPPLPSRTAIRLVGNYPDRYIEVTWVVLTQGAAPVLGPLKTRQDIVKALWQLASLPASCLLNVEVFGSAQSATPSWHQTDQQVPTPALLGAVII